MSFMKPPECDPLGNIIPDSLFYCTGLSILMIYLFSKNSNFPHMDSCVASLFFCLLIMEENVFYIHVLPIVLAFRGLIHV